jgi:hypothetical protein
MKRVVAGLWITTGVVALGAIALFVLMVIPASARLSAAVSEALEAQERLAHLGASAVDDAYERDLRVFAEVRITKAGDVEVSRARLAARLDAPFPDMKIAPGASQPASDEFQRAYNFNGDQLKSRIRDFVHRSGGPSIATIPLIAPPFSSMTQIDPATVKRWQRFANIEARVLETAAKVGAFPMSVIRLDEEPPPPDDADAGYERIRIGLDLACPEGRVGAVVHALLPCFDAMGGITRLGGVLEAAMPEDRLRENPDVPAKRVFLTLSLGFPTPIEEAP